MLNALFCCSAGIRERSTYWPVGLASVGVFLGKDGEDEHIVNVDVTTHSFCVSLARSHCTEGALSVTKDFDDRF